MNTRPKLLLIDIDGCLLVHRGTATGALEMEPEILPGVLDKFNEWDMLGYKIVLTTGRKESCRAKTEEQLRKVGLFWDAMIMGFSGGDRFLINDLKRDGYGPTAVAINLHRNVGMVGLDLDKAAKMQRLTYEEAK